MISKARPTSRTAPAFPAFPAFPVIAIAGLLFLLSGAVPVSGEPHFNDDLPPARLAESLVAAMSDDEAVAQVLMVGYSGVSPQKDVSEWIGEWGLGGVKIFGWNAPDLRVLAAAIGAYQETALASRLGIPLLVATDQEGGWVRHVKGGTSSTPGNMAIGASGLPYDAWMTGWLIGRELGSLGINMNFAPTVDVFSERRADVIGPRSFSSDPARVGILGLAYYKGLDEAGVISTAKHFPGHGDTRDDSHGTLPVIDADLETLAARDLAPYRTLIAGGIPAVMVGHLAYPSITGTDEPATLSPFFLDELLRDGMGFRGIVVTDDLFMRGVRTDGASLPVVCRKALEAGSDLLLISRDPEEYHRIRLYLIGVMRDDPDFAAEVRIAARRVVEVKARYLKRPDGVATIPDPDILASTVPAPGAEDFFLEQACRSVSVVKNERLPLPPEEAGRVLLAGAYGDFLSEGLRRYPGATIYRLPYSETPDEFRERGRDLARTARDHDTVIFLLQDAAGLPILSELEDQAGKVVIFSVLSPVHLDDIPWARTALAAYGTGANSFAAGFAVLRGDFEAAGRVPIPLTIAP